MFDGQNIFHGKEGWIKDSYNHGWQVDEILDSITFVDKSNAMIVVGIFNIGLKRFTEYMPSKPKKLFKKAELKNKIKAHFPRRFITRENFPNDEEYIRVTPDKFLHLMKNEQLAFHWSAHGLNYGIPRNINQFLANGTDVIFNCSRAALNSISQNCPNLEIIVIVVSPSILRKRLISRGRESIKEINNGSI